MPPDDHSLTITRKTCTVCKKDFFTSVGVCPTCGDTNLIEVKRDAFIGRTLADRYQVESLIGTGGMGVVYRAWQEGLKRNVAIKVLRKQFLDDQLSVKRFQQEAIAASRLTHPNIVTLHDYGSTDDGYLFMVMDLLEGRSLSEEQRQKKTIGVDRTIKIISQVCDALEHAHRNGVVHRDLKPGNIMLINFHDDPDYVKLVDFGIAKLLIKEEDQELTQKGDVFGSPLYMSPEQCLGRDLDGRSDIYSLGAVLYEALTGEVPHMGKNIIETIDKQIHREPQSFSVKRPDIYIPERLEAVVMRALAKDPNNRQQTMRDLAIELQSSVPKKTDTLKLRSSIEPAKQAAQKLALIPIAIVTVLLVIGAVLGAQLVVNNRTASTTPSHTVPPGTGPASQASKVIPTVTAVPVKPQAALSVPAIPLPLRNAPKVPASKIPIKTSGAHLKLENKTIISKAKPKIATTKKKDPWLTFGHNEKRKNEKSKADPWSTFPKLPAD